MKKTLFLIDANALIHRAYHALPPLTAPSGEPVGALYGLSSVLLKLLREQKPDYAAAAFDRPEPTFRDELFREYKAHRPPVEEELIHQLAEARELFRKFGVRSFEEKGLEADDIIASLVSKFKTVPGLKIVILTGDLDTLQLVHKDKVVVQAPKKGLSETFIYNEDAVRARFGVPPRSMTDYKALVGDPSDNIPGIPGIGPKTAAKLLGKYGSVEGLFKRLGEDKKLAVKIGGFREQAELSKKLVTLKESIPLDVDLNGLSFKGPRTAEIVPYFARLGFQSLVKRFADSGGKAITFEPKAVGEAVIVPSASFAAERRGELSSSKLKIAFDWKEIIKELSGKGIEVRPPIFDVKVAGWLIDPGGKDFSLNSLYRRFFHESGEGEEAIGLISRLAPLFEAKIGEYGLGTVFEEIEMPLIEVLAFMEKWGIGANAEKLRILDGEISAGLEETAKRIYEAAGTTFNINSSQQLSRILFEKLGIKAVKVRKTKSGLKSTSFEVLKELKNEHPIISLILDYRENFKIASTFVRPLIKETEGDGRVRTNFIQTGTSTGRIASAEPNLQNLPQESRWSKRLRECFETPKGFRFLALDYSQLELRLLAHVSGDRKLRKAFIEGIDAHRITASQIFNVPPEKVTPEMRRVGKTLNFGVIYGMGARAFSEISELPLEKSSQFIEEYFGDFPEVKAWQDRIKNEARTFGFVRNENGRRRWFLEGASGSPRAESETERAAVNFPIQSLGADIIKKAMIGTFQLIKEKGWLGSKAKLVLTIHDELLFEVRDDILEEISGLIRPIMENVQKISVPLSVEMRVGKNLGDLEKLQNGKY
ncbi:MAG TPA: DNA polymerase [Candidatus Paceibacterota bacterium]|nr:DNA polymerase [Candidatus Paceibacterota bacterium]